MYHITELTARHLTILIQAGESETTEFKTSFQKEVLETVGAFSNAHGGVILIGIKDAGTVCGMTIGKQSIEDIANQIQRVTEPRIQPAISIHTYQGKKIISIQILKNMGTPISIRGRYLKRSGRTNQSMSHEEIMQRMRAHMVVTWDAYPEPSATLADLDLSLVDRFMQTAQTLGRRPISKGTSAQACLEKLDLLQDNTPTRAALLLFGRNPQSFFPSAFLKIGRFRSLTMIVDDREVHGSLIEQLDGAMRWFRDRLSTEFVIVDQPEREVHWEYPLSAIREAVVNILCHRDYTDGAHSQIRLYDDQLELWNAGALSPPLTPDCLYQEHDSMPRNRKIAEIFFYMGFIERWGSGTLRITQELSKAGLPKPEFMSKSGRFKAIFQKQAQTQVQDSPEQPQSLYLSPRQRQTIAYIKKHGRISNAEYQVLHRLSKPTATRDLNELKAKKILIVEGIKGRGTVYRLPK